MLRRWPDRHINNGLVAVGLDSHESIELSGTSYSTVPTLEIAATEPVPETSRLGQLMLGRLASLGIPHRIVRRNR